LGTFDEQQAQGSSTLREVSGYVGTVELAANSFPDELRNATILITGDNQGAVSCVNNLRSPVLAINQELQRLFRISCSLRCDVLATWVPRDLLGAADALSREPDASDWGINPKLYDQLCKRFQARLDVDLFGSDSHHTAPVFVSRLYTPGCSAVDAFRSDWRELCHGRLAWISPPIRATSVVLSRLEIFKINAYVVLVASEASNEIIQLKQMVSAHVSAPFYIPRSDDSLIASMRVRRNALNPAFLGLAVYRVSWI
jgi:hypothetical protein